MKRRLVLVSVVRLGRLLLRQAVQPRAEPPPGNAEQPCRSRFVAASALESRVKEVAFEGVETEAGTEHVAGLNIPL